MSPLPEIRPHRGDRGAQGMTETKHCLTTQWLAPRFYVAAPQPLHNPVQRMLSDEM